MSKIVGYHRPSTVEEALGLLGAPGVRRVPLGGGTGVNADLERDPIEVVDLQGLGLSDIAVSDGRMTVGATTRLQALVDHASTPPIIADLARREAPSTLRAMATIGGVVAAADPESELYAALLVSQAMVSVVDSSGVGEVPLDGFSAGGSQLITAVSLSIDGALAVERTVRTPADTPIVAVVGRRGSDGSTRLAGCGVGPRPVLFDDPAALSPPGDFRGSAEYRSHLAAVHVARVREALA
jgi:CO/xanthine dehydrogenase FAD-binding subunit